MIKKDLTNQKFAIVDTTAAFPDIKDVQMPLSDLLRLYDIITREPGLHSLREILEDLSKNKFWDWANQMRQEKILIENTLLTENGSEITYSIMDLGAAFPSLKEKYFKAFQMEMLYRMLVNQRAEEYSDQWMNWVNDLVPTGAVLAKKI